jgi:acetolactate synthase regulatory subunit
MKMVQDEAVLKEQTLERVLLELVEGRGFLASYQL